jgi:tetratricopeptide (TPR) repeat protein
VLPTLPQALEGLEKSIKTLNAWLKHDQQDPGTVNEDRKLETDTTPQPHANNSGNIKIVVDYLAKAKAALDSRRHQDAIAEATKALQLQPGNSEGFIIRGRAYLGIKDYAAAYADGKELAASKPNSIDSHMLLGFAQLHRQQHSDAVSHFTNALRIKSDYADALAARSEAYMKANCPREALNDANSALRAKSTNWRAYMTRAIVQLKSPPKNCTAAVSDAKEVIRHNPNLDAAYSTASEASYCLNDFAAAHDFANRFINMSPNKWIGYMARGAALAKMGRHREAIADYSTPISLDGGQAVPYCARAASYAALDMRDTGYRDHLQCQTLKNEKAQRPSRDCNLQ